MSPSSACDLRVAGPRGAEDCRALFTQVSRPGLPRSWGRARMRVEPSQNVGKAGIGPHALETRCPLAEEGKQHVAVLNGLLTHTDGRLVIAQSWEDHGHHE